MRKHLKIWPTSSKNLEMRGQGMGWAKDIQSRLRAGKRYLKTEYKVGCLTSRVEMIYSSY